MTLARALWTAAVLAAVIGAAALMGPRWLGGWHVGDLGEVPLSLWGLAVAGMGTSYAMRALRLRAEWRGRQELETVRCLQVVLLHAAAVNVMPLRGGELGFPWLLHRYWRIALPDAASSLLWLRLQDAVVLAWLAGVSAVVVLARRASITLLLAWFAGACMTALLVLCAVHVSRWSAAWLSGREHAPAAAPSRVRRWMRLVATAAIRGSARAGVATWCWSALNWLVKIGALGALLAATAGIDGLAGWCGALGGELAAASPAQPPAGFGSYEAASALASSLAGDGPPGRLLAGALVVHVFVLATSLVGALVAWVSVPRGPGPAHDGGPA